MPSGSICLDSRPGSSGRSFTCCTSCSFRAAFWCSPNGRSRILLLNGGPGFLPGTHPPTLISTKSWLPLLRNHRTPTKSRERIADNNLWSCQENRLYAGSVNENLERAGNASRFPVRPVLRGSGGIHRTCGSVYEPDKHLRARIDTGEVHLRIVCICAGGHLGHIRGRFCLALLLCREV